MGKDFPWICAVRHSAESSWAKRKTFRDSTENSASEYKLQTSQHLAFCCLGLHISSHGMKDPSCRADTTQIEVDSLPYRSKQGKESLCETCSASLYCILCRHSIIHCEPVALCRTCYTSPMHCNSWSSPFWSMRWSRWADDQQVTKHLDHMLFLGWAAPPDSGVSCPPDPHPIGQTTVRLFSWPLLLCWDNTYSRCKICSSKMLETRVTP